MKKRIISLVLILTMLGLFVPMEAFASPQTHPNTYTNTGDQREDILGVAKTQLGYTEGSNNDTKYGDWYGKPNQQWCAMFVSWCARQANIPTSVLQNSAAAGWSSSYFNVTRYDGSSYTPKSGDLFFERDGSHVGLVYYLDGSSFYSIEGNYNDKVCSVKRTISGYYFGVPNYQVNIQKPTEASITINKKFFMSGDAVNFTFWGNNNPTSYWIGIEKKENNERVYTEELSTTSFSISTLTPGDYVAFTSAANSAGLCRSNSVEFIVWPSPSNLGSEFLAFIEHKSSGLYMTNQNTNINCTASDGSKAQIWKFTKLDNNAYRIDSQLNSNCMEVAGGNNFNDDANIQTASYSGTANQQFYIFNAYGAYYFSPVFSRGEKMVDMAADTHNIASWISGSHWTPQEFNIRKLYTVSYNANGGTGTPANQTKVQGKTLKLSAQTPTRDGYAFGSWNTKADGSGTTYYPEASYTADAGITLYAQWIQTFDFNVDFRLDGKAFANSKDFGTFDVYLNGKQYENDITDYYRHAHKGTTYEIKDIKAKTGYKYEGVYSGSLTGTFNANTTVVLNFSTNKYTVTYDANGGTGAPAKQTKVHGTDLKLSETRPKKDGYDFTYWTPNKDGTGTKYYPGDLYKANADVTLYAQWVQTFAFNVDFRLDGKATGNSNDFGTFDVYLNGEQYANDVTDYTRSPHKGTTYEIKDIKAKTGYKYEGVYSGSLTGTFNANTTVVLNFSANKYTVTYDANGGTGAPAKQTKVHGTDLKLSETSPKKDGYAFTYWTPNKDGTGTKYYPGDLYKANSNVTLYAQWVQTFAFNVDFRLDGKPINDLTGIGSFDVYLNGKQYENDVVDYTRQPHKGTTYEIKDIKAKTGYKYEGVYSGSLTGTFNANTTVVLNFSANKYTVTYDANGGTGAPAKQTKVHGTDLKLSETRPKKDGYDFTYWTPNKDGTGTKYYPGDLYKANANVTLYAQWVQTFAFNVDFRLDGKPINDLTGIGSFDIYLNGKQYENDVVDYTRQPHKGTIYEIKDIKAKTGYKYEGVYSGSLTGTFNANTTVVLNFSSTLKITTQPVNKTINLGDSVTLSLKAQGSGLTYQWYFKKAGQTSFSKWNNRTHASETCTPNDTWNGIQLYCIVKDSAGNQVKSNTITVTVNQECKIVTQPTDKTINLGDSVTLSLKAQGSGLTYQWYFKKVGQTSWNKWNNRTHASETVTPNATWDGIKLYCLVKDASGNSVNSKVITVTVKSAAITITQQPANVTTLAGSDVKFTVKASGTGLKYQWQYKKSGQTAWSNWGTRTTASTTATANATWNGMQVRCVVTDSAGNKVTSSAAKITIK